MFASRRPFSKEVLYTIAPLAIAAGFAAAAHGGWLCSGHGADRVNIVATASPGTSLDIRSEGAQVTIDRSARRGASSVAGVDPLRLGSKIYRATETHWVPRAVVKKASADPSLLALYGEFVPVKEHGRFVGYRLVDTMKQGLLRKLGFKDGDLLTAINGASIGSQCMASGMLAEVQNADQVTVTVIRRGKTLQKKFLVE